MERCGRCGERMSLLTGMPFDKRFYDETGRYVGRCSSCEAAMHMECLLTARLSDRKAEQVGRFVPLKPRTIRGQPPAYYLCRDCERHIDQQVFDMAVRTYESARRFDDLVALYEAFGFLDLATQARSRGTGRGADADLGSLISRLSRNGAKVIYPCPKCGRPIQIDGGTDPERLRFCGRCGEPLDPDRLWEHVMASMA